jgi:hypothetical protein
MSPRTFGDFWREWGASQGLHVLPLGPRPSNGLVVNAGGLADLLVKIFRG